MLWNVFGTIQLSAKQPLFRFRATNPLAPLTKLRSFRSAIHWCEHISTPNRKHFSCLLILRYLKILDRNFSWIHIKRKKLELIAFNLFTITLKTWVKVLVNTGWGELTEKKSNIVSQSIDWEWNTNWYRELFLGMYLGQNDFASIRSHLIRNLMEKPEQFFYLRVPWQKLNDKNIEQTVFFQTFSLGWKIKPKIFTRRQYTFINSSWLSAQQFLLDL